MKRLFLCMSAGLATALPAMAQSSSLRILEEDLQQAKVQHDSASSQQMTTFLSSLDSASQSPNDALTLYQNAGGTLPDATAISKHYAYETPTEKADRQAVDQQKMTVFATVLQFHCGLMKNAALIVAKPNDPKVQEQWLAWLKNTATLYPQMAGKLPVKNVTMKESVISKYLGFHGWGQSDQGGWSLQQLPGLYRSLVLEPLRGAPSPATLDAWNVYIAMVKSDDPDPDHFAQSTEPALDFDKAADDYAIRPSMDKLQVVDLIIKSNPTSDHLDDWITRARQMIAAYGGATAASGHTALPGPTPGTTDASTGGARPGWITSGTTSPTPTASPGVTSSGSTAPTPTATPGASYAGTTAPTPVATPGSTSSGTISPTPIATPGITPAGSTGQLPTASPGTPSSGGPSPTPTATP